MIGDDDEEEEEETLHWASRYIFTNTQNVRRSKYYASPKHGEMQRYSCINNKQIYFLAAVTETLHAMTRVLFSELFAQCVTYKTRQASDERNHKVCNMSRQQNDIN